MDDFMRHELESHIIDDGSTKAQFEPDAMQSEPDALSDAVNADEEQSDNESEVPSVRLTERNPEIEFRKESPSSVKVIRRDIRREMGDKVAEAVADEFRCVDSEKSDECEVIDEEPVIPENTYDGDREESENDSSIKSAAVEIGSEIGSIEDDGMHSVGSPIRKDTSMDGERMTVSDSDCTVVEPDDRISSVKNVRVNLPTPMLDSPIPNFCYQPSKPPVDDQVLPALADLENKSEELENVETEVREVFNKPEVVPEETESKTKLEDEPIPVPISFEKDNEENGQNGEKPEELDSPIPVFVYQPSIQSNATEETEEKMDSPIPTSNKPELEIDSPIPNFCPTFDQKTADETGEEPDTPKTPNSTQELEDILDSLPNIIDGTNDKFKGATQNDCLFSLRCKTINNIFFSLFFLGYLIEHTLKD